MSGEKDLALLLRYMQPILNEGEFVFCTVTNPADIHSDEIIMQFRETEGITLIIRKTSADALQLPYTFVAAWITLSVHSSLEAVGLTAAFSNALSQNNISCNVVAAYYHDHVFVDVKDTQKAMDILDSLSR